MRMTYKKRAKDGCFRKKRVSLLSYKSTEGWTMKNPGLKDYRLNSMEEPTDEQLHALMEKVAEDARRQSANAKKVLERMMQETRERITAIRREQEAVKEVGKE